MGLYGTSYDDRIRLSRAIKDRSFVSRGKSFDFLHVPLVGDNSGANDAIAMHRYGGVDGLDLHVHNIGARSTLQPLGASVNSGSINNGIDYSYGGASSVGTQWALKYSGGGGYYEEGSYRDLKSFTIGTDKFYGKLTFSIGDVSKTDWCLFGFRRIEEFQLNFTDYADYAALNASAGDIETRTRTNTGTEVVTTNIDGGDDWADGEEHSFAVFVNEHGGVYYEYDDVRCTSAPGFNFDDEDVVTPFFYFKQNTGGPIAQVILKNLEWGIDY